MCPWSHRLSSAPGSRARCDYGGSSDHVRAAPRPNVLKAYAAGRVFGVEHGAGPPGVLALHGWARTHRDFLPMMDEVAALALDLPGFGASPEPPEAWSTADYADCVAVVLDDLGPDPVVVVGHSFGGRVAVQLAARHPERVLALVLTGVPSLSRTPGSGRRSPLAYRTARRLHRAGLLGDDRMEALRRRHGSPDYRAARGVMRDVLVKAVNESYEAPLAAYPGPIELVWGADDDQAPRAVAEAALGHCARGRLTVVADVGHFVPRDAPNALVEAIRRHEGGGQPR